MNELLKAGLTSKINFLLQGASALTCFYLLRGVGNNFLAVFKLNFGELFETMKTEQAVSHYSTSSN